MQYTLNDEIIEDIRDKNNIVEVISQYISLKRAGSNYKGVCPFHNEKTPSFVVSDSKQIFHCFGCGEGGDVISFIMKYSNISFVDSVKLLADRVGVYLEESNTVTDINLDKKNKVFEINREAAMYFYNNLIKSSIAINYLADRSVDKDVVKAFGLGFATAEWDGLLKYLLKKGYKEKEIYEAGLIIERKNKTGFFDRFRDRIIFPIINTKNKVIGFGGRVLGDSQPKYLNSPDTISFNKGYNLYGINNVKKFGLGKEVILVEGYMDVIALYKNGIKWAVASLGTALTSNQAKLLKRYGRNIYICYDSDNAGQNATNKALDILREEGIDAKVIILKDFKDPDEFFKINGVNEFNKHISNSLNYLDYKIYLYKNLYDISTIDGKIKFTNVIAENLKKIKSPIEKDAYITKVAHDTGISSEAIKREVYGFQNDSNKSGTKDKYINNKYRNNNKDRILPVKITLNSGHIIAEKELLKLIIDDINLFNKVKDRFKPEDFLNNVYRELADFIYNHYENNEKLSFEDIEKSFDNEKIEAVKEMFTTNIIMDYKEKEKALEDYISKINRNKLDLRKREIIQMLNQLENKEIKNEYDEELSRQLKEEFHNIQIKLKLHH